VEVWTEKDAITGVVRPVTLEWDVPLVVAKGYVMTACIPPANRRFEMEQTLRFLSEFRAARSIARSRLRQLCRFWSGTGGFLAGTASAL
jgi:hypothetical protein